MQVFDLRRKPFNPKTGITTLDSCAFNASDSAEAAAAQQILQLGKNLTAIIFSLHSVREEIAHPNTPQAVKDDDAGMFISTIKTELTDSEQARKDKIDRIIRGKSEPETHAADITNIFEASKRGAYFVTVDARLLKKAAELKKACGIHIVKPSEWLSAFHNPPKNASIIPANTSG